MAITTALLLTFLGSAAALQVHDGQLPGSQLVAQAGQLGAGMKAMLEQKFGKEKTEKPYFTPWTNRNLDPDTRAELLLKEMSIFEKGGMLHGKCMSCPYVGLIPGIERLGIPPLNQHDGPQGFRTSMGPKAAGGTSTSWPGAMAISAIMDPKASYEWGSAMGKEFESKGANVQLGPGLNLARVPKNGRNFEYISGEDPFLGWKLAGPVTKGIQEHKVIACGKHYVANSQEDHRMDGSEDVDERTLWEMYYPPFEASVKAGLGSIMCAYNKVNSEWGCENDETLNKHLRAKMGFKGFVMSDWGATHSASLKEGLDMEMPVGFNMNVFGMTAKHVNQMDMDKAVRRILRTMFEVGVMDENPATWDAKKFFQNVSKPESHALARKLGAESTVLLKNKGSVLPLPQGKHIALIGFASENALNIAYGHGSGEVPPSHFVSPLTGIKAAAGAGSKITFHNGNNMKKAEEAAEEADYAIVFVGASATEGGDRKSLNLDGNCKIAVFGSKEKVCDGNDENQNDMVRKIAKANKKTIVVASVPGAIIMPWSNDVSAILTNFMPGEQVGNAIADVLFGKVNPAARLPVTMPNKENEIDFHASQYPGVKDHKGQFHAKYSEKLLVGYRYYEKHDIQFTTGFPFGHGLSYTSFEYSHLNTSEHGSVSFTVKNSGDKAGAEVAQLYLGFPAESGEPPIQLKGFHKTSIIQPGETQHIKLKLENRDMSIWDINKHDWAKQSGDFKVFVGASSRDIRLNGHFNVGGHHAVGDAME